DYIDHYLFHVGGEVPREKLQSAIHTVTSLKLEGKIRSFGWSTDHVLSAECTVEAGRESLTFTVNLLQESPGMVELCERKGIAAICIAPLAMGFLSGKYGAGTRFSSNDVRGAGHDWVTVFRNGEPVQEHVDQLAAIRDILTSDGRSLV